MKICVIFKNFGPYHVARMAALSSQCSVLPIEISETSADYRWGDVENNLCARTTLISSSEIPVANSRLVHVRLLETLGHLRPDAVAVPGWWEPASLAAIQWARRADIPAIMMSESNRHDERRHPYREFMKRQVVRMCSAALVGGASHAAYVRDLGMDPSCIADGYDVVDNGYFARGAAAARNHADANRDAFQLPANYFLASSRLLPRKNLIRLVAAWDLYRKRITNRLPWSLVIVGYGAEEQAIRTEVEVRGISQWVKLMGFQPYEKLPVFYGLAGAFIHPALSEPWGLVVNEAMAAGLPCIVSSACGCAPDLVNHGETGFQFDPQDTAQLADLMARISMDAELRARLAKNAEVGIRDWSPSRFGNNLAHLARTALHSKKTSNSVLANACLRTLLLRAS